MDCHAGNLSYAEVLFACESEADSSDSENTSAADSAGDAASSAPADCSPDASIDSASTAASRASALSSAGLVTSPPVRAASSGSVGATPSSEPSAACASCSNFFRLGHFSQLRNHNT